MWTSMTRRFPPNEMQSLELLLAEQLAEGLLFAEPIVALRGVAEVLLNDSHEKLEALLRTKALTMHWRKFESDWQVDNYDHEYARQLEAKILELGITYS